jgi:DNA repair protein RadC
VAHNHPSGKLTPSEADKEITKKITKALKLLDITLLDHLILTSEGFVSFSDSDWL